MSDLKNTEKPRENCWQCFGKGVAVPLAAPIPCDACWPVKDGQTVTFEEFFAPFGKPE